MGQYGLMGPQLESTSTRPRGTTSLPLRVRSSTERITTVALLFGSGVYAAPAAAVAGTNDAGWNALPAESTWGGPETRGARVERKGVSQRLRGRETPALSPDSGPPAGRRP